MTESESHCRLRSLFYDKVGLSDRTNVPGGDVNEKTRLQELLAETPLPVTRLCLFCCRYKMPDQYRQLVWKLILKIVPRYAENCSFEREQRSQMFYDSWQTLLAMRLESLDWRPLEATDDVSLFLRYTEEVKTSGKLYGVGIPYNHCIVDNTDQCCNAVRFVSSPVYSDHSIFNIGPAFGNKRKGSSPLSDLFSGASFDSSVNSDQVFMSPDSYLTNSHSNRIQRRNSCTADVGHYRRSKRRDTLPTSMTKDPVHRLSGNAMTIGMSNPVGRRLTDSYLEKRELVSTNSKVDELLLDALVYGVFHLKKHYVGFAPSSLYANEDWDFDAIDIATFNAVPSLVDTLLMWMMNTDRLCYHSYTSQIVNGAEMGAYLCIGHHLNSDAVEESFSLRCSVWDLVSKKKREITQAVLVTGRRILGDHSSAVGQILETVSFFDSPRLPYIALSLFSNILSPVAAEKVLDKVIAECFDFLGYLFVELVLQIRHSLSVGTTRRQALLLLTQMKHSDADCAVNSAVELYHKEMQ